MIDRIYIEETVAGHPRTEEILRRLPDATQIPCRHYGEVFNRRAQNFRLQKRRPALILARKTGRLVLEAPPGYGIGGTTNFYFSHMLNCIYDCRYCFLQGMYRSAHYVLFVNYEDFEGAIEETLHQAQDREVYLFSGYDGDSLALEFLTGFARHFVPFFSHHPRAWLELRTKSTQIQALLEMEAIPNGIVAFSFTPDEVSRALEHGVPPVARRLQAMTRLAQRGWRLGLRFDPLIHHQEFKPQYRRLFQAVFETVPVASLHSVSLGPFRLPQGYYKTMTRLYPDEPLFAGPLERQQGMVSYPQDLEQELETFCREELLRYIPREILFHCTP